MTSRKPQTPAKPTGTAVAPTAKAIEADMASVPVAATRPLLNSASVFRAELQSTLRNAEGEIDLLDAIDARADDAHRDAIELMESKHATERSARNLLRAEYVEIVARCKAALGLSDGEGQGQ